MHRFRRPFPVTRRDTDDVQLNTLDRSGMPDEVKKAGKHGDVDVAIQPEDVEHGHLQELEVDMDKVLGDADIESLDADTSPYPEGKLLPDIPHRVRTR